LRFSRRIPSNIGRKGLTPLQLLVNKMAEDGYSKSAVKHVRTYLKACFEYAIDEDLIPKNPARKLALPNIHKKPCERFLRVEEVQALLTAASPREHLVLRILAVCGLRPGEALALRIDDYEGNQLRVDEALKERQLGEARIGDTKTDESDSYVPVPPDLGREIAEWIAAHPKRDNPRAFLFLNRRGTAFSVGNYLKKQLKPLAQSVGILDLTQAIPGNLHLPIAFPLAFLGREHARCTVSAAPGVHSGSHFG
jgi:integrase